MSSPATYQVLLNDSAGQQMAEICVLNRLDITQVFNGVGRAAIELPYDRNAEQVNYGTRLQVLRSKFGYTRQIFNGQVKKWKRVNSSRQNSFNLTCEDENAVLANSLALPVPLGPPFSTADFDARTGPASSVMMDFVKYNIGPSARSDRRRVTMGPDYAYGVTISEQARWENLLDVLKRCAVSGGGLGFKVENGVFSVYYPETKPVLISYEMGNLDSYEYAVEAARANHIFLGAAGEGTSRTFYETSDAVSINRYGRIEQFVNRTDVETADIAATAMSEEIYKNSDKTAFSATTKETEATRTWVDFSLGDRVTVEADGLRVIDLVREINLQYTANSDETLKCVIGNTDGVKHDPILASLEAHDRLAARVRRLETI